MKALTQPLRILVLGAVCATSSFGQTPAPKGPQITIPPLSPTSTVKHKVGFTEIEIVYSRPSLRGRKIFGDWEPYGEVWRTGANSATRITFSTAVKFDGKELPAGTYALQSIPGPKEWTIIFNKGTKDWGAYAYKQENDALRVKAKVLPLAQPVETFTIDLNDFRTESATLNLMWEKTHIAVPFTFDVKSSVVAQVDAAMSSGGTIPPGAYYQSAMFYLENGLDLAKAKTWIEKATAGEKPQFFMLYGKARILAKLGDKAGATAAAKQSIAAAEAAAATMGQSVADEYKRRNNELLATLK
ncbi:MAG: DUF2911 domain-containing protein [Verrucomicrobiota bacterium]